MSSTPSLPVSHRVKSGSKPPKILPENKIVSSVVAKKTPRQPSLLVRLFRLGCFVAIVLGLCAGAYLCLRPNSNLRGIPWLPAKLELWADYHGQIRNLPAFAVLALPFMCVCNGRRARRKAILWLAAFVTGTELAQHFIPGRWCEWQDVVSGCAGLLLTWGAFELSFWGAWRVRCILKRRQTAKNSAGKIIPEKSLTDRAIRPSAGK